MDWQASNLNNAWRVAFRGLVRRNPAHQDPRAIEASLRQLDDAVGVIDGELGRTRAYVAGPGFTVADIVIGLTLHRWRSLPAARPASCQVARYLDLLSRRRGFERHGPGGGP